jgi:anti-anti-sigma factor
VANGHDISCDATHDGNFAWSVVVRGEVDMTTAPRLASTLDDAIGKGARLIVVRLEHVTFIDSSGLGVLLKGADRIAAEGGQLFVEGASAVVERLLKVSGVIERLRRQSGDET